MGHQATGVMSYTKHGPSQPNASLRSAGCFQLQDREGAVGGRNPDSVAGHTVLH